MKAISIAIIPFLFVACASRGTRPSPDPDALRAVANNEDGTVSIFRAAASEPLLTHHAKEGIRPYIHPLLAPDGHGYLTEFSPGHHKHQTGIYWGLKEANGRDYFMNWKEDYYRKVADTILADHGKQVRWRTVYDLLDERGEAVLTETQTWSFQDTGSEYVIDLEWKGAARQDVTMRKFYVGGLFLRMPWVSGIEGQVINAAGQRNGEAEGQRAIWTDIGIRVPQRSDQAHIAILDHPDNAAFPVPWRVDNELGVGPSRQILGDWSIRRGDMQVFRYRLFVYTGAFDEARVNDAWKSFVCDSPLKGAR